MSWVRLDDTFTEHPKVLAVGGDAAWLHVCALSYCNRLETDGEIPEAILHRLSDRKNPLALAERLVVAGLWDHAAFGWVIHDYHDYQPSKADLEERRARQSAAGRLAGKRSGEVRRQRTNAERNANEIVRESFDDRSTISNPRPDPTRPVTLSSTDTHPVEHSAGAGDNSARRKAIATAYGRQAVEIGGTSVKSPDKYASAARERATANPELERLAALFPTAPPDVIAAALHGNKHSLNHYPRSDELAPVVPLHA